MLRHNPEHDTKSYVGEESPSESDLERSMIEMKHVHLPKLEAYGFIDWDRETHEVTKGPKFEEIRPLIELLEEHQEALPAGWR